MTKGHLMVNKIVFIVFALKNADFTILYMS